MMKAKFCPSDSREREINQGCSTTAVLWSHKSGMFDHNGTLDGPIRAATTVVL